MRGQILKLERNTEEKGNKKGKKIIHKAELCLVFVEILCECIQNLEYKFY